MRQRSVAILAEYLSHRPFGRIVALKPIGDDDYVLAIEDVRAVVGRFGLRPRRPRS